MSTRTFSPRIAIALAGVVAAVTLTMAADAPTPDESLMRLKAGNARFVANAAEPLPVDAAKRLALVGGQHPFATILSWADKFRRLRVRARHNLSCCKS